MRRVPAVLCCVLPLILGVPLTEHQHELNEEIQDPFKFEVPSPKELAKQAGYTSETYDVITEDRYVVQLHRISGSKRSPPSNKKPAVLLFHGLLDCSPAWLIGGPEKALGFILADQGYDVWMGDARGNRYSRKHLDLTVSHPSFWEFSWHEMGVYDLPAMIDHILYHTKQEKIFMVSHSQGGTAFFVMGSERPEYQQKIAASFNLAPAVFLSRTKSPFIRMLAPVVDSLETIAKMIGLHEFKPSNEVIQRLGKEVCREGGILQPLCKNVFFLIIGYDEGELDSSLLSTVAQYDPAGASSRQFIHYGQIAKTGKFQKYDHGVIGNLLKYHDFYTPEYNLRGVKTPVYLFYGGKDRTVDTEDSLQLYDTLPNVEKFFEPTYTHLDFLWGVHAKVWVYDKILTLLTEHKNKI